MSRLKPWNTNGSISSSSFHVQLVDCYYSRILALSNQWMKFSFNEMRMWGQSKISSCCICDWCKSSEKGGRGNQAMQHNFVLRIPYPLPKIAAISHKAKIILSMQKKNVNKTTISPVIRGHRTQGLTHLLGRQGYD